MAAEQIAVARHVFG